MGYEPKYHRSLWSFFRADQQGEFFHRYILGVYSLYERLIAEFPEILFESCASGGARFDAGMLYYAPQCWASDDTDAVERTRSSMEPAWFIGCFYGSTCISDP